MCYNLHKYYNNMYIGIIKYIIHVCNILGMSRVLSIYITNKTY